MKGSEDVNCRSIAYKPSQDHFQECISDLLRSYDDTIDQARSRFLTSWQAGLHLEDDSSFCISFT